MVMVDENFCMVVHGIFSKAKETKAYMSVSFSERCIQELIIGVSIRRNKERTIKSDPINETKILFHIHFELISYLDQSAIVLAVNAQASLSRVRRNNIAKEIYGSEVLLPIKIKDTPKMFDETETERVRKLAKSIRKNNEAKQSLLKLNYHSKSNIKKSVNSSGNISYNIFE
ncbi:hypothetical protein ACTFIW_010443 [Dictyostelium discoideum]